MARGYFVNSLGDYIYSDKKHEEEMAKLSALTTIANKSSSTSPLLYIIPIGAIIIFGIVFYVVLKKKSA